MEHVDTAESLTSAAEIPDQANFVESQSDLLLLPYATPTTTSKTADQAAQIEKNQRLSERPHKKQNKRYCI